MTSAPAAASRALPSPLSTSLIAALSVALLGVSGCATSTDSATTSAKSADYDAVIASVSRPDADRANDAPRKALETLQFIAIAPGDTVVDLEAGSGYFTELFALSAGETGRVYLQNPEAFDVFLGTAVSDRVDGRLANVTPVKSNFDALPLADESADVVTWIQGPHELWYVPEGGSPLGDPAGSFAEIVRVMKPGATFIVIDHSAPAGSGPETGGDTHRIAEAIVRDMAAAAGLIFVVEADFLRNAEDPRTQNVFDPAIRRKTDQFVLKFQKPE